MASQAIVPVKKPEYIDFLLSPAIQDHLGFHVNVGTPDAEVERIGCLRWMLIARSQVFRKMLYESPFKVGVEIDISDLKPDTFKELLTYIYGYDPTSGLPFEKCVELLGAAEKYDVADLKSRLDKLITDQVSTENVCTVLEHGPVCETAPQLWEKTTEIIQTRTNEVFAAPQFLSLSPSAVVHILQQDILSVPEIDVWRASLSWARSQLSCDDAALPSPELMRNTMNPLLRHTRLCTIPQLDISKEVVPSCLLNEKEIVEIFVSINTQVESSKLGDVCSSIKQRERKRKSSYRVTSLPCHYFKSTALEILVKEVNLELVSGVVKANECPWPNPVPRGLTYICSGTIKIEVVNYSNNTSKDLLHEIPFSESVEYDSDVELQLKTSDGRNVVLSANNKYRITVDFTDDDHVAYEHGKSCQLWNKNHFDMGGFTWCSLCKCNVHHLESLNYRVNY